jgi:hypothetical protein
MAINNQSDVLPLVGRSLVILIAIVLSSNQPDAFGVFRSMAREADLD